jgi:pyrimidodiazepine synthase
LNSSLTPYEEALNSKFFGGSNPAMVDYMLWPWIERFPALKDYGYIFNADGKFPKLAAWIEAMEADPAVKRIRLSDASLRQFLESSHRGQTVYDIE